MTTIGVQRRVDTHKAMEELGGELKSGIIEIEDEVKAHLRFGSNIHVAGTRWENPDKETLKQFLDVALPVAVLQIRSKKETEQEASSYLKTAWYERFF